MAARDHRVSRRVLLGAACAFPLRRPGLDPQSGWIPDQVRNDDAWRGAFGRFPRAEVAVIAATGEADEDRYDALLGAFNDALRRLLRIPAPNLPALSTKIDLAIDHEVAELTGGEACLAALARDARRLARFAV